MKYSKPTKISDNKYRKYVIIVTELYNNSCNRVKHCKVRILQFLLQKYFPLKIIYFKIILLQYSK